MNLNRLFGKRRAWLRAVGLIGVGCLLVSLPGGAAEASRRVAGPVVEPLPLPVADEGLRELTAVLQRILNYLLAVGSLILLIALAVYGYKIATAIDPRGRADAIHGLYYVLLGGLIAFGGTIVVKVILGVLGQ